MGSAHRMNRRPAGAGPVQGGGPRGGGGAGNGLRSQSLGLSEAADLVGMEAAIVEQIAAALRELIPDIPDLGDIPDFGIPDLGDIPDFGIPDFGDLPGIEDLPGIDDIPGLGGILGPVIAADEEEQGDDTESEWGGGDTESEWGGGDTESEWGGGGGESGWGAEDAESAWAATVADEMPSESEVRSALETAVEQAIASTPDVDVAEDDTGFAAVVGSKFDQAAFVEYGGLGYIDVGSRTNMVMPDIEWELEKGWLGGWTVKPKPYATPADINYPSNSAPPGNYTRAAALDEADQGILGRIVSITYLVDGGTSAAVRSAEEEHAQDTVDAYNMSVGAWGRAINANVGVGFKGGTIKEAQNAAMQAFASSAGIPWDKWGASPESWSQAYQDLTKQTIAIRDKSGSHTWKPSLEYVIAQNLEAVCSLTSPALLGPGKVRW